MGSGVAIATSRKFDVGEEVQFGDETKGIIVSMGYFNIAVRGDDGHVIQIPNSDVQKQRLVNLSRTDRSQELQTLRFMYEDFNRMNEILEDIKLEIESSCPTTIRELNRAYITEFDQDC